MSDIVVVQRTQKIVVNDPQGSVSLVSAGPAGPAGPPGAGLNVQGTINYVGPPIFDGEQSHVWVDTNLDGWAWDGAAWVNIGQTQGPQGVPGVTQVGHRIEVRADFSGLSYGNNLVVAPTSTTLATEHPAGVYLIGAGSVQLPFNGVYLFAGILSLGALVSGTRFQGRIQRSNGTSIALLSEHKNIHELGSGTRSYNLSTTTEEFNAGDNVELRAGSIAGSGEFGDSCFLDAQITYLGDPQ